MTFRVTIICDGCSCPIVYANWIAKVKIPNKKQAVTKHACNKSCARDYDKESGIKHDWQKQERGEVINGTAKR